MNLDDLPPSGGRDENPNAAQENLELRRQRHKLRAQVESNKPRGKDRQKHVGAVDRGGMTHSRLGDAHKQVERSGRGAPVASSAHKHSSTIDARSSANCKVARHPRREPMTAPKESVHSKSHTPEIQSRFLDTGGKDDVEKPAASRAQRERPYHNASRGDRPLAGDRRITRSTAHDEHRHSPPQHQFRSSDPARNYRGSAECRGSHQLEGRRTLTRPSPPPRHQNPGVSSSEPAATYRVSQETSKNRQRAAHSKPKKDHTSLACSSPPSHGPEARNADENRTFNHSSPPKMQANAQQFRSVECNSVPSEDRTTEIREGLPHNQQQTCPPVLPGPQVVVHTSDPKSGTHSDVVALQQDSGGSCQCCFITGIILCAILGIVCVVVAIFSFLFMWWLLIPGVVLLIMSCVFCCLCGGVRTSSTILVNTNGSNAPTQRVETSDGGSTDKLREEKNCCSNNKRLWLLVVLLIVVVASTLGIMAGLGVFSPNDATVDTEINMDTTDINVETTVATTEIYVGPTDSSNIDMTEIYVDPTDDTAGTTDNLDVGSTEIIVDQTDNNADVTEITVDKTDNNVDTTETGQPQSILSGVQASFDGPPVSYGVQQDFSGTNPYDVSSDRSSITLYGNAWKALELQNKYIIKADTVLEFEFSLQKETEGHLICVDEDASDADGQGEKQQHRCFFIAGSDGEKSDKCYKNPTSSYGGSCYWRMFANTDLETGEGETNRYRIPVGHFAPWIVGMEAKYIAFISDSDADRTYGESTFSDIKLYDDTIAPKLSWTINGVKVSFDGPPVSYGVQQDFSGTNPYDISADGKSITLYGNAWKALELHNKYIIKADTVLEFEFSLQKETEGHLICVDEDASDADGQGEKQQHRCFFIAGSDGEKSDKCYKNPTSSYGGSCYWRMFANTDLETGEGETNRYRIPVGHFVVGMEVKYIAFISDSDADRTYGESTFSDIKLLEGS